MITIVQLYLLSTSIQVSTSARIPTRRDIQAQVSIFVISPQSSNNIDHFCLRRPRYKHSHVATRQYTTAHDSTNENTSSPHVGTSKHMSTREEWQSSDFLLNKNHSLRTHSSKLMVVYQIESILVDITVITAIGIRFYMLGMKLSNTTRPHTNSNFLCRFHSLII